MVEIVTNSEGYDYVEVDGTLVSLARLTALAEYTPEELEDREVHHRLGTNFADFVDGLDAISKSEHRRLHSEGETPDPSDVL